MVDPYSSLGGDGGVQATVIAVDATVFSAPELVVAAAVVRDAMAVQATTAAPSTAMISSAMTFDVDITLLAEHSAARFEFEADFRTEMAGVLGGGGLFTANDIVVDGIVGGSAIVLFHVKAPKSVMAEAASMLSTLQASGTSITVDGIAAEMSTMSAPVVKVNVKCDGGYAKSYMTQRNLDSPRMTESMAEMKSSEAYIESATFTLINNPWERGTVAESMCEVVNEGRCVGRLTTTNETECAVSVSGPTTLGGCPLFDVATDGFDDLVIADNIDAYDVYFDCANNISSTTMDYVAERSACSKIAGPSVQKFSGGCCPQGVALTENSTIVFTGAGYSGRGWQICIEGTSPQVVTTVTSGQPAVGHMGGHSLSEMREIQPGGCTASVAIPIATC